MIYGICCAISIIAILWLVGRNNSSSVNELTLAFTIALSDAGYFAIYYARNIEEAILANKLSYVVGIFGPMIMLIIVCEICQIVIPPIIKVLMYFGQFIILFLVCTTGYSTIFYKTISFTYTGPGSVFSKTYGPMHTVYLVTMWIYMIAGVAVAFYSLSRKNVVSVRNVEIILATDILSICVYAFERFISTTFELVPVVFTISMIVDISILAKISMYSPVENGKILKEKFGVDGRIVVDNKFRFMGANETATRLFPELNEWELEKKIPGNGGRFNTYLRQPLREYIESGSSEARKGRPFELSGKSYMYDINTLTNSRGSHMGFVIELSDVTDIVVGAHSEEKG